MSTALAALNDLPPASKYGPEDPNQEDFTKSVTFLPRIQFFSDASGLVKRRQFPANHYGLVEKKDSIIDLGDNFVGYILAYRYKALDFREKGKVKVFYDPRSPEFLAVKEEANRKRNPGEMSGCMYGAEFLIGLNVNGKPEFATLICSTNSWKAVTKKMFGLTRQFVSFGSKLIDGKYVYTAPEVATYAGTLDLGDIAKITKVVAEFNAASGVVVEDDEGGGEGGEDSRVR